MSRVIKVLFMLVVLASDASAQHVSGPAQHVSGPPATGVVDAAGQPTVNVVLGFAGPFKVEIRHKLRFDGIRYFSVVEIVGLRSTLVPFSAKALKWTPLSGVSELAINGRGIQCYGVDWEIIRNGETEYTVAGQAILELYHYCDGQLRTAIKGDSVYTFTARSDGASEIERIDASGAKPLVSCHPTRDGSGGRLTFSGGKAYFIKYCGPNQIEYVRDAESGRILASFTYADRLLRSMTRDDGTVSFSWAWPDISIYVATPLPIEPLVRSDGIFEYRYIWRRSGLKVVYREIRGTRNGAWSYKGEIGP